MTKRLHTFLALFLVVLTTAPVYGSSDDSTIPAAAARAELERLYETLQDAHFDLYVHRSREAYDAYFCWTMQSLREPMSRLELIRTLMAFTAYGHVGHARIDFPVAEYIGYAREGGTLLPFDVRVDGERSRVAHNYSDSPSLEPGTEIVAIDGRAIGDWLSRLGRYVSAERPYMEHAQLEAMLPRLFWLDQGRRDAISVTVRDASGTESTVRVEAAPIMDVEQTKGTREAEQQARTAKLLSDRVGYLRPGPFYAAGEDETLADFEAFVDESFQTFLEAGVEDLILDLRNNPGGDNSFSDPMIAWFADRPFRFASRYELKASESTRTVLRNLAREYPGGVSAQMLAAMESRRNGEQFAFEIPEVRPREDRRYEGRVWVLVNRHSYSNATTVAAIVKDYGFGTLIGEETSDLPTSYASSAQFTLPETSIGVTYPKGYFVRPNGDEAVRGVIPDLRWPVDEMSLEELAARVSRLGD